MIRVSIFTANGGKITFECKNKREANKVQTTWRVACDAIEKANADFEKGKIDKYEYYCRAQSAINMCSVGFTSSLTRKAKYLGNPNA